MNNTIIFLRHASTQKDTNVPIEDWNVKPEVMEEVKKTANLSDFDKVDLIFTSTEKKSVQTAQPFANRLSKEIIQVAALGEIKRPDSEKLSTEDYEKIKVKIFEDFDFTTQNWETANQALERFKKAVEKIDSENEGKTILIVAHGTVMTLYFAYLLGKLDDIFSRWKDLGFGSWGMVQNGKVVKDIV